MNNLNTLSLLAFSIRCISLGLTVSSISLAQTNTTDAAQTASDIEEVKVVGKQIAGPQFDIKSTQTRFDLEAIEDLQPGSVFDILSNVPGVDLTGGPRANGISINVRGFADNEDVLVIVDGAVKNFEKYRFGSVLPEPELLRELTVSRGPASVLQGSGAIGGVIEMETKDAADFLEPDDPFGGFVKLGFAGNNDELLTIGSLYGRPTEHSDALISFTKRDGENLELSTGEELPYSEASPEALLTKIEWRSDIVLLGLSYSSTYNEGLELFDTSAPNSGVNGQVYRQTEDQTFASYLTVNPDNRWIDAQFNLAYTDTVVDEQSVNTRGEVLARGWNYQYDIWSGRAHNTSTLYSSARQDVSLQFGVQALQEERTTAITDSNGNVAAEAQLSQPSGKTLNWGTYLQAAWQIDGFTATLGYRWDHNNSEVLQAESRALLQQYNLPTRIEKEEGLLNYRLEYSFNRVPVTLFHSYVETARYPKLDEYFTQSSFSRCRRDSSSAEALVTQLRNSQQETEQAINDATDNANANLDALITEEIAIRDGEIAVWEAYRALWISEGLAAVADGTWTQAQYDAELINTNNIVDSGINTVQFTANNNIDTYTTQIQNSLAANISSLQTDFANQLAEAGINDPNVDLAKLDFPTRTTLPEPYQSLQVCGALYEPELANNREWGISYSTSALLTHNDGLQIKLTYYVTEVDNLLESMNTDPDNPASQPGEEKTWGYELESTYIIDGWRFDLSYNKSKGEISGYTIIDNPNGSSSIDDTMYAYQTEQKYDMPADELALTSRWISPGLAWELGVRVSYKYSRDAEEFVSDNSFQTQIVEQDATTEVDLFAGWRPVETTHLRLTVDNATNESYKTPGGIDENGSLVLGNYNTGRNIKFSLTQYF